MQVYLESVLDCPPETVWEEVQKSRSFKEVGWPLVRLQPVAGQEFPERWQPGETVHCRAYNFGFIPLGLRTLKIERIDQQARQIQTREVNPLARRWDHLMWVEETEDGRTVYSEEIEIEAGRWTWCVWCLAFLFYRHRQRKWQRLAERIRRQRRRRKTGSEA